MKLHPFFCYYGGKWRAAPHYPKPLREEIIEPFAGAAGYSTRYFDKKITLYDVDPIIVAVWQYLISTPSKDILALPIAVTKVDDLDICQSAKWLIGFWLNQGCSSPRKSPSKWARMRPNAFWGECVRQRIASQVDYIRHWTIAQCQYSSVPNKDATWFIDPPYQVAGKYYRYNKIDYVSLGSWCVSRMGQVLVCENAGADWLPFKPFRSIAGGTGKHRSGVSHEVLYTQNAGVVEQQTRQP